MTSLKSKIQRILPCTVRMGITLMTILVLTSSLTFAKESEKDGGSDRGGASAPAMAQKLNENFTVEDIAEFNSAYDRLIAASVERFSELVRNDQLKKYIIETLNHPDFMSSIPTEKSRAILQRMLNKGLLEDINRTTYVLKDKCVDTKGQEKFLETTNGALTADICVNPTNFYERYYGKVKSSDDRFKFHEVFSLVGNPEYKTSKSQTFLDRSQARAKVVQNSMPAWNPMWQFVGFFLHDHARHYGEIKNDDHSFGRDMVYAAYAIPRVVKVLHAFQNQKWNELQLLGDHTRLVTRIVFNGERKCMKDGTNKLQLSYGYRPLAGAIRLEKTVSSLESLTDGKEKVLEVEASYINYLRCTSQYGYIEKLVFSRVEWISKLSRKKIGVHDFSNNNGIQLLADGDLRMGNDYSNPYPSITGDFKHYDARRGNSFEVPETLTKPLSN